MPSHLQQLLDSAIAEEITPLGALIENAVGGLDDDQMRVVAVCLQRAVLVGLRVGISDAVAQMVEQGVDLERFVFDISLIPPQ